MIIRNLQLTPWRTLIKNKITSKIFIKVTKINYLKEQINLLLIQKKRFFSFTTFLNKNNYKEF
jgi:hypothetical protein